MPTEPVTPELVLVDPELALHARARLPDTVPQSPAAVAPAASRGREQGPPDSTPRLVGAGAIIPADRLAADARSRQTAIRPSARKGVAGARRSFRFLPTRTAARSLALVIAASAAAIVLASSRQDGPHLLSRDVGPTGDQAAPSAPRPRVATTPQTFVWLPVEGTSHYRVEFYRSGKRVLRAFPSGLGS